MYLPALGQGHMRLRLTPMTIQSRTLQANPSNTGNGGWIENKAAL